MDPRYDVIVVGARCAGAATAMLLARRGHRVLLVDRGRFPSDTLSTHVIHPPGVDALRRWGLLDSVTATGCPPIERYSFDFGPCTITGTPSPVGGGSTAYAPRRYLLDAILVRAAADAGVEVRERVTVDDVVREDGVVSGVAGHGVGGLPFVARARVVVGADGRSSRVARAVGAQEYLAKPRLQWGCYTYWRDLPCDAFATVARPGRGWGAIPTNDGLTLVVVGWPMAEAATYKADVEGNYLRTLDLVPGWGEALRQARRAEPFRGGSVRNVLRTPHGPGWVLAGDAGCTMDPITAQGMSNAFLDAESCVDALDDVFRGRRSFREAMVAHHRARDARVLPMYGFTTELATLASPPAEMQQLLIAVSRDPAAMDGFAGVVAGTVPLEQFFAPDQVARIIRAAA